MTASPRQPNVSFCPSCGAPADPDAATCYSCGYDGRLATRWSPRSSRAVARDSAGRAAPGAQPVTVAATVLRCPRCRMAVATWATTCPGCGGPIRTAARPPAARPPAARPQAPKPQAPRPAASPARRSSRPYVAAAIVVVVALAAGGFFVRTVGDAFRDASSRAAALNGPTQPPEEATLNPYLIPPAGSIWFGTSFDPVTFEVLGRAPSISHSLTMALVAHLTETIPGGQSVSLAIDGVALGLSAASPSPYFVYALTILPAWVGPGQHTFKISTMDGAELASGTVTVTP